MKTIKRIIAVVGLIFFLFALSYLIYTGDQVDVTKIETEIETEQTDTTEPVEQTDTEAITGG